MDKYKISVACRGYDRTETLILGRVKPEEFDLDVTDMTGVPVPKIFEAVHKGQYNAGEFSLAELAYSLSRNAGDLIGIPVFLHRMFRHQYIFCNTGSNIARPEDLSGKRIAFPRIIQAASVWIRGHLVDDYGVSAKDSQWYTVVMHHWEDEHSNEPFMLTDGSLSLAWKDHYEKEEEAIFGADPWAYGLEKNRHVLRKFLSYCHDIGISSRAMSPNELFHESTWDLNELSRVKVSEEPTLIPLSRRHSVDSAILNRRKTNGCIFSVAILGGSDERSKTLVAGRL